jgi:AcrR family transcriptional regulator
LGIQERKEREKELRRNEIVDAAEKLFLAKGYLETTMDDVAREAELSKGTLYLYFKSKEDLYHALVLRGMEILLPLFERAAVKNVKGIDKVKALTEVYVDFVIQHRSYVTIVTYNEVYNIINEETPTQEKLQAINNSVLKLMIESIQAGILDGSIRKTVDPMQTSLIITYSCQSVLRLCAREADFLNAFNVRPQELITTFFDFIYQALKV